MVDIIQIVLLSVIVLLSIVLIILGVQVFFILRDLRQTVKKTNKVLDDIDLISENIAKPISSLGDFFEGAGVVSTVFKIVKALKK